MCTHTIYMHITDRHMRDGRDALMEGDPAGRDRQFTSNDHHYHRDRV